MQAQLNIRDLRSNVILGVRSKERAEAQEISINIRVIYAKVPHGCIDDNVKNTLCYDEICSLVVAVSKSKPYKLIEHMSFAIIETLKEFFYNTKNNIAHQEIYVEVIKLSPPIFALKGGASFSLTHVNSKIDNNQ